MEHFTGFEYIKIDIANQYGLDKELFEPRIEWVNNNLDTLESLMDEADEPILYIKAVNALRDAQNRKASGHLVGFDACSSGLQIMSCLIGCETTARNTGLIDPNVRADMYSTCRGEMNGLLEAVGITIAPLRSSIKEAQMTHFYNSKAKPKEIFGEDTVELEKFYEAQHIVAPGACEVMEDMQELWDRDTLAHSWTLPDGFRAHVKVIQEFTIPVEVDELGHTTFSHMFHENCSTNEYQTKLDEYQKDGISLPANITHSIDGMVVREMNRRCNYNPEQLTNALEKIRVYLDGRAVPGKAVNTDKFISLVHAENINKALTELSISDVCRLRDLILEVLNHRNFPIVCVHDEFKCHANNMNRLRYWYKEILAEIAESELMSDICSQLLDKPVKYQKYANIADKIRNANYHLS